MFKYIKLDLELVMIILCAVCLGVCAGCQWKKREVPKSERTGPRITKVVVAGFRAATTEEGESGPVRDPLSGNTYIAEPVDPAVADSLTWTLFDMLVKDERYKLISPGQAKGVYENILESEEGAGMETQKIMQKVGAAFNADTVLWGYVYKWRERKGKEYGVEKPASVAFDLQFTSTEEGSVLWRRMFGKTQKSLSENLLDISTFVEGKGRWMTAEDLARMGLKRMIEQMPQGKHPGDKKEEVL